MHCLSLLSVLFLTGCAASPFQASASQTPVIATNAVPIVTTQSTTPAGPTVPTPPPAPAPPVPTGPIIHSDPAPSTAPPTLTATVSCNPSAVLLMPCAITGLTDQGVTVPLSTIQDVQWYWGDGSLAEIDHLTPLAMHTYAHPGSYQVLTIVNILRGDTPAMASVTQTVVLP